MTSNLMHADWRKSSHSGIRSDCVEVAPNLPGVVALRDSKRPNGPVLFVPRSAFRRLIRH